MNDQNPRPAHVAALDGVLQAQIGEWESIVSSAQAVLRENLDAFDAFEKMQKDAQNALSSVRTTESAITRGVGYLLFNPETGQTLAQNENFSSALSFEDAMRKVRQEGSQPPVTEPDPPVEGSEELPTEPAETWPEEVTP